jgi:hypothetical protein
MSLKEDLKGQDSGALEVRSLHDVKALTDESIENISDSFSDQAFEAVRNKSAQKLAFKVASHADGIVEDARDLLDDFLPKMFVIKNEPLTLDIKLTTNVLEAA